VQAVVDDTTCPNVDEPCIIGYDPENEQRELEKIGENATSQAAALKKEGYR
jgi:hypothetical protein